MNQSLNVRSTVVCQSSVSGGAELYLNRLYSQLRGRGLSSTLVGSIPGWEEDAVDARLSPKWSRRTILLGLAKAPSERDRVAGLVAESQPDVIHLQFKREQIAFTRKLARIAPVVWTEHGRFPPSMRPLRPAYARAANSVSNVICVSDSVRREVDSLLDGGARVEVIENAVPEDFASSTGAAEPTEALRRRLGVPLNRTVVLWVGRLAPGKIPDIPLRLARAFPDLAVVVVGGGSRLDWMKREARDCSNLTVVGPVQDPRPYFDAADAFMFTSSGRGEGLPTTILEAAGRGLRIVGHEGCGVESAIVAAGGRVVRHAGDVAEWMRLLAEPDLPEMVAARQAWVQLHSVDSWVDAHCRVLTGAAGL